MCEAGPALGAQLGWVRGKLNSGTGHGRVPERSVMGVLPGEGEQSQREPWHKQVYRLNEEVHVPSERAWGQAEPAGGRRTGGMEYTGWHGIRGLLEGTAGCNARQAARGTFGSVRAVQGKGGCCPESGRGRILRNPLPRPMATWPHCSGPAADQGLGALVTATTTSTQLN